MRTPLVAAAAASLVLAGAGLAPSPASGQAPPPDVEVLARGLVSPLSLAVAADGTRYFSENFKGKLRKQTPSGTVTTLFKAKGGAEVGAVSESGGLVRFAISKGDNESGVIKQIDLVGNVSTLANLTKHEKSENPDHKFRYGFRNLGDSCKRRLPDFLRPASYRGVVETHPYATTLVAGTTYVADAGANAIFAITPTGEVSTVAAVKPARVKITAQGAKASGLPDCTVGKNHYFEAVPTDVEMGPDGNLYVTSLPGGPEDGSLGAQGRVLRINPVTGETQKVAGGLVSPTGLAVATDGDILVAELFGGRIARIPSGKDKVRTFAELKMPGDVEINAEGLVFATGSVLTGLAPGGNPRGKLVQFVS